MGMCSLNKNEDCLQKESGDSNKDVRETRQWQGAVKPAPPGSFAGGGGPGERTGRCSGERGGLSKPGRRGRGASPSRKHVGRSEGLGFDGRRRENCIRAVCFLSERGTTI